ncbi:MAG: tRNA (N(6)-L-threonylcarbamoyladenosine(37)-C(2))-methylthiotransferase MtaB [Fusobacteriia bacterium 4572_132]|nr:MAG: tRNA (N(6)-L-threonylcarbamoyladenosine(37)-C(2))-methylthiotransferase MtaB [Fusobacteriia bacterium 4572_132]
MNSDKKIAFYTLGCKVNQYETDSIKQQFKEKAYEIVKFDEKADIYIINTCTVTNIADRKSRNLLRKAKKKNPDSIVIAMGCYAQTNAKEISEISEVDYIIGNKDKQEIIKKIEMIKKNKENKNENKGNKINVNDIFLEKKFSEYNFGISKEMSRVYIKIQDGCNNYCSYCKIPFARGKERSRNLDEIINEVEKVVKAGFFEIILIGINLGAYGRDLDSSLTLEDVLENVSNVKGVKRIRLGSIYPDNLSDRLIDLIKKRENIMPHLHISLQNGDTEILKLMKRNYDRSQALENLWKIKRLIPELELTADIIIGFPGEKEENFINTYRFIKEIKFSDLHIFPYSDRENTLASKYKNKVSSQIKKERIKKIEVLQNEISENIRKKYISKKVEVLMEEKGWGYTKNYLKVFVENSVEENKILKIKVVKTKKGLLIGEEEKI